MIMSDIEEPVESFSNEESLNILKISPDLEKVLKDIPEVMKYIKVLQKYIKKQRRKLKKLKLKNKDRKTYCDIGVQTDDTLKSTESKNLVDEIREAAELATQKSGFVYDESSGLYYDSATGYYYNAEYSLYYDAATGTYMTYNQDTKSYEFYSKHEPTSIVNEKSMKKRDYGKDPKVKTYTDLEQLSNHFNLLQINQLRNNALEAASQWPPCMRLIVEQTQSVKIKIGTLFILTYEGGTLGREGDGHAIIIPDINVSKSHLRFGFDCDTNRFFVSDLGSRNGTVLNGKRLASTTTENDRHEVAHGSRIQIGSVVLLCHVHEGTQTCGLCEPGLVQLPEKNQSKKDLTKSEKHKHELKNLRKKFGVSGFEEPNIKLASGYTDRAQKRRETIGSQNPHEKTEVASLNESISSQNKGFKMLEKMGWKEGDALGKESQGILEPVELISNAGTSGIGAGQTITNSEMANEEKRIIWKKTQERFDKIDTFDISDESD